MNVSNLIATIRVIYGLSSRAFIYVGFTMTNLNLLYNRLLPVGLMVVYTNVANSHADYGDLYMCMGVNLY